jgi:hypothetical protein
MKKKMVEVMEQDKRYTGWEHCPHCLNPAHWLSSVSHVLPKLITLVTEFDNLVVKERSATPDCVTS